MTASTPLFWRSELLINDTVAGGQTGPSVTALSSGGFIVVWTDASGDDEDGSGLSIRARFFDTNGNPQGDDFVVNSTVTSNQADPQVVQLAGGNIVIAWGDGSQSGGDASGSAIRARILTDDGVAVGSEFLVNGLTDGNQYDPVLVAREDGGFNVLWTDDTASWHNGVYGDTLMIRNFDASGNALSGSSSSFNSVGWETFGTFQATETEQAVARLGNGDYVIVWTEANPSVGDGNSLSVKAQIWNGEGSALSFVGPSFVINTTAAGQQLTPSVTGLSAGGFVVTWVDGSQTGGDTSSWAIRAQIFDADGAEVGAEFLVNATTADAQYRPVVTALDDGGFIVFYEDTSTFGATNYDVLGQRFDVVGAAVGSEFLVNSFVAGAQWHIDAATLADGRVVVVWEDGSGVGDASGTGIHSIILDPLGGEQVGLARILVTDEASATDIMAMLTDTLAQGAFAAGSATQFSVVDGANGLTFYGYGITYDGGGAALSGTVTGFSLGSGAVEFAIGSNVTFAAPALHAAITAANGGDASALDALLDGFGFRIEGNAAADALTGRSGGDLLIGGAGDDAIDGNDGADQAQYSGEWTDYAVTQALDGAFTIVDMRGGSLDGADTVADVENFVFADGTVTAADLLNAAPTDILLSSSVVVDGSGGGTVVGELSASDPNNLDGATFSLISDPSGYFEIVGDELRIAGAATVDLASGPTRTVTIRVTDAAGLTHDEAMVIDIAPSIPRWVSEFLVNTSAAFSQFGPQAALLDNGQTVVIFADYSNIMSTSIDIRGQVLNADGSLSGAEFVISTAVGNQFQHKVTALDDGRFLVTWRDSAGYQQDVIRAQIYDATGVAIGNEIVVTGTGARYNPEVESLPDGKFVISWENGDAGLSYAEAAIYNSDGSPFAAPTTISAGIGGGSPAMATRADGQFIIVWGTASGTSVGPGGVQVQLFNADTSKNGSPFKINFDFSTAPSVTALADGNYVIVWSENEYPSPYAAKALILDADGNTVVSEFIVSSAGGGDDPFVTALSDGGFVVTWLNPTNRSIRGQMFDADGNEIGNEFSIGPSNNYAANATPVVELADGRILVVWDAETPNLGDSDAAVHAQILDPRTARVVRTGGAADEDYYGTGFADSFAGAGGDDVLSGSGGDDTLTGGPGGDTLNGGDGIDTASYAGSGARVIVDLAAGTVSGGHASGDMLSGIENLVGSDWGDILTGDASANSFIGGFGNDQLSGGGGGDFLEGGVGADTLSGGNGSDTASFAGGNGVTISLFTGMAKYGYAHGDTLISIENLAGSAFADELTGNGAANVLSGDGGNDFLNGSNGDDRLFGGDGNDVLFSGAGADVLDGGDGTDTANYSNSDAAVQIDLATGVNTGGHAAGDTLASVEIITGSTMIDLMIGGGGVETFNGGIGDDTLVASLGGDRLNGNQGIDTVDYSGSGAAISVSLQSGISAGAGSFAEGDLLSAVENLIGTAFADNIVGTTGANVLSGGAGADQFNASLGNDQIFGEAGNDVMVGGAGADVFDGGADVDWVYYSNSDGAVSVDLAGSAASGFHAQGDTLAGIENLYGSVFGDTLAGDDFANTLVGYSGDDILSGGAGSDTLLGALGADRLEGGADADYLSGGAGADVFAYTMMEFGNDTIIGFEDGADRFDLTGSGLSFSDFAATAAGPGTRLTLTADQAHSILILGIAPGLIDASDFV